MTPTAKTDQLDCRKLAALAAKDMVRPIAIPTEQEESLRALERRRHQVADSLREVKQPITGFLLFHGLVAPPGLQRWTKQTLQDLAQIPLDDMLRDVLDD